MGPLMTSASAISEPNAKAAFRKLVVYPKRKEVIVSKSPEIEVSPVLTQTDISKDKL